jgi:hypothetical protein
MNDTSGGSGDEGCREARFISAPGGGQLTPPHDMGRTPLPLPEPNGAPRTTMVAGAAIQQQTFERARSWYCGRTRDSGQSNAGTMTACVFAV